jgi:hypothetical protein
MTDDSRKRVAQILISCIVTSLQLSGHQVPEFNYHQKPLKDISGFDSPLGVEVTVDLEIQLGIALPDNIFIKETNGRARARSLSEVILAICHALDVKGE